MQARGSAILMAAQVYGGWGNRWGSPLLVGWLRDFSCRKNVGQVISF